MYNSGEDKGVNKIDWTTYLDDHPADELSEPLDAFHTSAERYDHSAMTQPSNGNHNNTTRGGNPDALNALQFMQQNDPNNNAYDPAMSESSHLRNATGGQPLGGALRKGQDLSADRNRLHGYDISNLSPAAGRSNESNVHFSQAQRIANSIGANEPAVGVGVYDEDGTMNGQHRQQFSQVSSEESRDGTGQGDFLASHPYQNLISSQGLGGGGGEDDAAVQRARSRQSTRQPKRPLPKAGLPLEPTALPVEPNVPSSRLSRRGIAAKKRIPDLDVGTVLSSRADLQKLQQGQDHTAAYVVDCSSCGAVLQTKKGAILIQCPSCQEVHPTAGCRTQAFNARMEGM